MFNELVTVDCPPPKIPELVGEHIGQDNEPDTHPTGYTGPFDPKQNMTVKVRQ